LPGSGSYREYYRIAGIGKKAIATYNPDKKENEAFVSFSRHFYSENLPVPEIYIVGEEKDMYLQQDLGDTTLYSFLLEQRINDDFPDNLVGIYKKVLSLLVKFQVKGGKGLDFAKCYPRDDFDLQSMKWDMHYFKYYFLKLAKIPFNEQLLEDDFETFANFLLEANRDYFLYRDFQSRNVMLIDNEPFFIDYQGGRKGALQYDLASLLYDAKADIPRDTRKQLLLHYIDKLQIEIEFDTDKFISYYWGYVYIRIMQALGAYGFRGFYEKKAHFLASIPFALENLNNVLAKLDLPIELPTLIPVLKKMVNSEKLKEIGVNRNKLIVSVNSFSYKRGIPVDESGHGGGFAFDCRALHNPGRYDEYKQLTGMDLKVIKFLDKEDDVKLFLKNVTTLVEQSVEKYLSRDFDHLTVNFGCTGGQHRSVYSAEYMARHLRDKYNIKVELRHREQEMKR
ncbi:MAG: phosphotransferase, partial [Bacteroidales bacterium]|nr:phosphotransferase [Bacteroidales bacterium]